MGRFILSPLTASEDATMPCTAHSPFRYPPSHNGALYAHFTPPCPNPYHPTRRSGTLTSIIALGAVNGEAQHQRVVNLTSKRVSAARKPVDDEKTGGTNGIGRQDMAVLFLTARDAGKRRST
jgi:hypothetical protein